MRAQLRTVPSCLFCTRVHAVSFWLYRCTSSISNLLAMSLPLQCVRVVARENVNLLELAVYVARTHCTIASIPRRTVLETTCEP